MPGATVTPKCLGAATGASREAACPDCKACRTALGGRCRGAADHTRSGAKRRARTTAVTIVAAAQNGTSGALACGKHARRRAAWATPRTGVRGRRQSVRREDLTDGIERCI
jgi:hypothetical protein